MTNVINIITNNINITILIVFVFNSLLLLDLIRRSRDINKEIFILVRSLAKACGYPDDPNISGEAILSRFQKELDTINFGSVTWKDGYFTALNEKRDRIEINKLEYERSLFHTIIEIFVLLGILGTVCAISSALSQTNLDIQILLNNFANFFGIAVNSTIYGLICAIIFMIINSYVDVNIERVLATRLLYLDLFERAIRLIDIKKVDVVKEQ